MLDLQVIYKQNLGNLSEETGQMVALKANYLEHKENLKACKKVGHFTAVSGPNKAHMDTISKLPKIIELC